jgi:hypothetical protein
MAYCVSLASFYCAGVLPSRHLSSLFVAVFHDTTKSTQESKHMISEDGILYVFFFLLIAVWKLFVRNILADVYLKVRNGTNLPESVKIKLRISFYKMLFSISSACLGVYVLCREKWVFRCDMYRIPLDSIPLRFRVYYIYEICFYLNEMTTVFTDPRRKDFVQLVIHHIVTLLLLHLSFSREFIKYGMLILALHDISHPVLEFSKIENNLGCEVAAETGFFVFMTLFAVTRLVILPRYLIWTSIRDLARTGPRASGVTISVLLVMLQIMHIIWTRYIVEVLMKIINREKPQDTRE